jgi:hypothetical protein
MRLKDIKVYVISMVGMCSHELNDVFVHMYSHVSDMS